MSLNVNFNKWGYITDWQTDSTNYGSYFTFLKPSNTILSWSNMVTQGYQNVNEDLDFSIAPWRINKKSAYIDIKGNIWYNNKNTVPSDAGKAYYNDFEILNEINNSPFLLTRIVGTGTQFPPYDTKYWAYLINGETKSTDYISANYQITNFRYDKIKLCPYIVTTTKTMEDGVQTNIYSGAEPWNYIPSYSDIAGLYVVAVGFRIYANINGSWVEKPLTITIPTYFSGDTSSNYFSGENGMKILRHPAIYTIGSSTHYNTMINPQPMSIGIASSDITQGESHAIETCYSVATPVTSTSTIGHGYITGTPNGFTYTERLTANAQTLSGCLYLKIDSEDVYNAFVDEVKKQLAYIGLPFVLKGSYSSENFDSDNVYLPIFDSHRCTTGNYTHGSANADLPNYNWKWIYELDELPPDEPDDPDEESDTGYLNNKQTYFYRYANPNAVYALTYANFQNFANDVNNLYSNDPSNLQQMQIDFKGVNPQDYIIGVYGIPFNVNYVVPSAPDDDIELGVLTLPTAKGKLVDTDTSLVRQLGHITIPEKHGDFRDYEPYTQIEIYLPFCGTAKLDPAQVVGHDLYLEYYYDILTLSCTACIYRDNKTLIHTSNGTIGASLPFTASAMGSYQNAMKQTENAIKRNEMNIGLGVASTVIGLAGVVGAPETGGASLALAGAAIAGMSAAYKGVQSANELNYELTHKQPQISQCSSPNGAVSQWIAQMVPVCFIKRAKMLPSYNQEIYAKTIGNSCCINDVIGNRSGLTICSSIDTSGINKEVSTGVYISPTIDEVNMIKQYFSSGVIV